MEKIQRIIGIIGFIVILSILWIYVFVKLPINVTTIGLATMLTVPFAYGFYKLLKQKSL